MNLALNTVGLTPRFLGKGNDECRADYRDFSTADVPSIDGIRRTVLEAVGRIQHFNIDKGLLIAGQTEPKFGGGKVLAPMRLFEGDRATDTFNGESIPVGSIVEELSSVYQFTERLTRGELPVC